MNVNLKLRPVVTGTLTDTTPVVLTLGDPRLLRVQVPSTSSDGVLVRPPGDTAGYPIGAGEDTGIMPYTAQTVTLVLDAEIGSADYIVWAWTP